jgi:hypothetical protein
MAKDAIDAVVHALDGEHAGECVTDMVPLVGAEGYADET